MTHATSATRVLVAALLGFFAIGVQEAMAAITLVVDDDNAQCPAATFNAIQPAIVAASSGDTIQVCPGNYPGNLVLNKDLTLSGAQAGIDARGRVPLSESTITAAGTLLTLIAGSAGSTN